MIEEYVFVYGTLHSGESNHSIMGDSEFIGKACTERIFYMVDYGSYPVAHFSNQSDRYSIDGELYRVTDQKVFDMIDVLEGHPDFFRREKCLITVPSGKSWIHDTLKSSWIYVMDESDCEHKPIIYGNWIKYNSFGEENDSKCIRND